MKKFSIIIPAFNVEKYIGKCINSILKQTFTDFEIIVIDDNSTDDTVKIVEQYNDERICLIKNHRRKFAGGARNRGIRAAKGEYIVFLDSDDCFYNESVLEKLCETIKDEEPDVVYTGVKIIGAKNVTIVPTMEKATANYKLGEDLYYIEASKCWNRKFLKGNNIFYPEARFYEDVIFNCKAIMKVKKIKTASFPLYIYLKGRENSTTSKITFKHIKDNIANIEDLIKLTTLPENKEYKDSIKIRIQKEIIRCKERLEKILEDV